MTAVDAVDVWDLPVYGVYSNFEEDDSNEEIVREPTGAPPLSVGDEWKKV